MFSEYLYNYLTDLVVLTFRVSDDTIIRLSGNLMKAI